MKITSQLLIIVAFLLVVSCNKLNNSNDDDTIGSVLIFNQGGFNKGEASISVFDMETGIVQHNAFLTRNNRPLGDVFQSSIRIGDQLYLVINNSKKIEVIDPVTLASIRTLNLPAHISPRYLAPISPTEGYITSLFTNYVYKMNLTTGIISDSVNVGSGSEGIVFSDNRLFVARNLNADFSTASGIVVIAANSGQIEKTIPSLPGPSMMVLNNNDLWINATGEWGMNNGGLIRINTTTREIVDSIEFNASTNGLAYGRIDNSVYVLSDGIIKYSVNNSTQNRISDRQYYGINVYENNDVIIYVADAKNYSDNGVIMLLNNDGSVVDSISAGIVPFGFYFR
jgi:hypothetical protein